MPVSHPIRARHGRGVRASAYFVIALVSWLMTVPLPHAYADSVAIPQDRSAWFWSSNSRLTICAGTADDGACQKVTSTTGNETGASANPISLGHLGVSMKKGDSDMRSYVHFDSGLVPFGAQITKYVIVLTVSQPSADHVQHHKDINERPPATANPNAAAIQACAVRKSWANADGDPPYSRKISRTPPSPANPTGGQTKDETFQNEPAPDCGLTALGVPASDGASWSFDITPIAKKWASLELFDEGVALLPLAIGPSPTWTIEFHGMEQRKTVNDSHVVVVNAKEAGRAIVEYSPAAPPPTDGGGGGFTPPSVPSFPTFPATPPDVSPPAGVPAAGIPPALGPPVAVIPLAGPAKTPGWFFGLLPLGILLFGLVSYAVGPDSEGLATDEVGAQNAVARVLHLRRLSEDP